MKLAIATDGEFVSMHFGRCEGYTFFKIENGKIVSKEFLKAPEHRPGFMPRWLKEQGVDVVIAGGAGPNAQQLFLQLGIEFILGVDGKISDVVDKYIRGTLKGGESTCDH